ncbi:MAG TPA: PAS domain S-box protein [Candidatus Binatia bacterium]|nr:PAS domain S-box protein [Candidatus Binatia bacterium]
MDVITGERLAAPAEARVSTHRRTFPAIVALAAIYVCAGKIGLSWAYLHTSASAVWPASGIGIAALLLWGYRLWPGIFVGAFVVNFTTPVSLAATLAIASGNTMESLVGAWLISRYANGSRVFERARDIFKFVLLAAVLSTAISATIGVSSLMLFGFATWPQYAPVWLTWWLGDMAGVLLVAPVIVIWLTQPRPVLDTGRIAEAAALLLSLLGLGYLVFFRSSDVSLEFIAILPLLWAAFRFGQRGTVIAAIIMSAIAITGTLRGLGPFAAQDINASLLQLQGFMATLALATLVLAAVTTESIRAERRLQVQDAVARIMAESPDLSVAGPKVLQVLCERAGWSTGTLWEVDRDAGKLVCVEVWHLPGINVAQFEAVTRERSFAPGVGLPGRVWSSGEAAWISDVTKDTNFPRAPIAIREGLHAAFGFPIKLGNQVLGVVECFSHEVRVPDEDFLQTVSDIGRQLGPFFERKRAEDALLQNEKELSDFFDTASLPLHWVGPDGTILRVNHAELKMLGYTRQEYLGRNIADFHADSEVIRNILKRLAAGEVLREYPARLRCKDGSVRDVLIDSSVYWKSGKFVHTRCFTRDITHAKRAEEARAMLAAIVESSADAIISKDLNGIITSWNTGAERLFGYTAEDMIAQSILKIIPPERHEEEANILRLLRRGERIEHFETVRLTRDGRRIDISLTVSPMRNSEGKIIGASKIARDISNRKRTEELLNRARSELLKANEELEKRVEQRTADLQQAHAALLKNIDEQKKLEEQLRQAQKMESIGTLAGGIAHDFNNVLNIIRAYATLVSRRCPADQQIVESMQVINEEIDRAAAVVRQLLTLARKTETVLARTDANQVVVSVSELIKKTFPKTIEINLDLNLTLPPVLADSNQLGQALLNICVNARDAMPAGGTLTFTSETVEGDELQQRHPDAKAEPYVCIGISDTGAGMDESVRARIFEPFFTTKAFGEGTGLGLAMVYGLIKNHNGFVDVESELGRGTTFRLYMPASASTEQPLGNPTVKKEAPAQQRSFQRGTVLVVEDEQPMIRLLSNVLQKAGYRTLIAMDGEEAMGLFQRHRDKIDLVLLDLNLPKADGAEVIRALKMQKPEVYIIVASGYLEPEMKEQLLQTGVKDYIHKPYSIDQVLQKLDSVFQNS